MRVATDDLAEIQDMIRDLNGSVEPEKQSLWQRLKGKLANFIELSLLAAEEMRIEAEEMYDESPPSRCVFCGNISHVSRHVRLSACQNVRLAVYRLRDCAGRNRLVSPRPEIIPVADRRAGVGLLAFFVSAFLRLRSPHR